jgi:hypothetical protein
VVAQPTTFTTSGGTRASSTCEAMVLARTTSAVQMVVCIRNTLELSRNHGPGRAMPQHDFAGVRDDMLTSSCSRR